MKIALIRTETAFDRSLRQKVKRDYIAGEIALTEDEESAMRELSRDYQYSMAQIVKLAIGYYFGDGKNHIHCENCEWWGAGCMFPETGEQTHAPILD